MWKIDELWSPVAGGTAYLITIRRFEMAYHEKFYDCSCRECRGKRRLPVIMEKPRESSEESDSISIFIDV
jgi:hypothetical protein